MEFYGIIGRDLSYSVSPQLHNFILKQLGIAAAYKKFDVRKDDVGTVINAMKTLSISGVTVTMPYKEIAMYLCDEVDETAAKIRAVNTLVNDGTKIKGYNTGYYGFGKLVESTCTKFPKTAVVLGNGGSAKAAINYLHDVGLKKIYIASRRIEDSPFSNTKTIPYEFLPDIKADLVVNATPVGMVPNTFECIIPEYVFANFSYAIDVVYNPRETEFLARSRRNGVSCAGGLEMLVWQTIRAEEIWHNTTIGEAETAEIFKYATTLL